MIIRKVYARNVEKHVLLNNIVDIELSRWLSLIILRVTSKELTWNDRELEKCPIEKHKR